MKNRIPLYELTRFPENIIPAGMYCYTRTETGRRKLCPYWSTIKSRPSQDNGFCEYLGEGDWSNPGAFGLIWDQVKECDVSWDSEEEDFV